MAKFVFVNIPAHSHVNPTLPVVQELVERGEEVIYYLTEPFRKGVEATGATFRSYESRLDEFAESARKAGKPVGLPMYMPDESLFVIAQIIDSIQAEQPDCIVYDYMCLSGRLLAEILHIPAVRYYTIFAFNAHLIQHFQGRAGKDPEGIKAFQAAVEKLCARYQVKPFHIGSIFTHEEPLNIVTIPRAFQVESEAFGDQYCFVGPSLATRNEENTFPFEQLEELPTLYITQGTVYNDKIAFFNICFAALAGTPWKVIMSMGQTLDQAQLSPIPTNFLVQAHVPQLEVLKHTNICVSHGGMATIMEALAEGVPLVVVSQGIADQGVNAARVAELGLGVVLDQASLTPEALRDAIRQISNDPTFYTRARQMQAEIHKAGGHTRAANALLDFVKVRV